MGFFPFAALQRNNHHKHTQKLPQWINNSSMTINSNRCQSEHRNVHAHRLNEWTKSAHKLRQVPSLKQRRLKLRHGRKESEKGYEKRKKQHQIKWND